MIKIEGVEMNDFNNLMNRLNANDDKEKNERKKRAIILTSILLLLIVGIAIFFLVTSNNKKKLSNKDDLEIIENSGDDDLEYIGNSDDELEIIENSDDNLENIENTNEDDNSGTIDNSELEIVVNEQPEEKPNTNETHEEGNNNNNNNNNTETVPVTYGFSYPMDIMTLELENDHFKGTYKDNSAYFTLSIYFDSNMKEVASNSELLKNRLTRNYPDLSELEDKYSYKVINNKNWFIINGRNKQQYFSSGYTIFKQGIASIELLSNKNNIEDIYKDINIILNSGTKKED